jgi:hypothetical protein
MMVNLGAAVNVIHGIRTHHAQTTGCPTWDEAGIRAALTACEGTPGSVLAAAALAAEDANLRAPSVAALRHHWSAKASSTPPRHPLTQRCPDHPEHDMPHDHGGDMTLEQIAEAKRVALAAAAANPYIPPAIKRAQALEETP